MNQKILLIALALLMLLSPLVLADALDGDNYACSGSAGMGSMMYGTYGTFPMIFSWTFSIMFFVVVILLIIWLVKQIQKK